MKRTLPFLLLILIAPTLLGDAKPDDKIVELPRPNSGTYSFKEAEERKSEIFSNKAGGMVKSWKNPYSGFSIHIHKDDRITIYHASSLIEVVHGTKMELGKHSVEDVRKKVKSIPAFGNPLGILITSEVQLKYSKVIKKVLPEIFMPSIQLFYVGKANQDGQAKPANPPGPETTPEEK